MKVSVLPLGTMSTNCLIVYDEAAMIGAVIDPGGEDSAKKITDRLNALGVTARYILLTHAHFDHMLSLEALREKLQIPLAIHEDDADALLDSTKSYMAQFAGNNSASKPAQILLHNGDTLTLGGTTLTVMHTPGHTMGSVCYISGDTIITGDTLFRGSIGRCDLYGGDEMAMERSLRMLASLEGDFKLYPGHGCTTTLSRERENNIYLKHLS